MAAGISDVGVGALFHSFDTQGVRAFFHSFSLKGDRAPRIDLAGLRRIHVVHPALGREKGRRRQRHFLPHRHALGEAAPGPVLCPPHEPGCQRISLDVPAHPDELVRGVDGVRLEAALIDRSLTLCLTAPMHSLRMGSCDPLHQSREPLRSHGSHDQVPVIDYQTVGHQAHRMPLESLVQDLEKASIISGILKERRPCGTAVDDVKEPGLAGGTSTTWHGGLLR